MSCSGGAARKAGAPCLFRLPVRPTEFFEALAAIPLIFLYGNACWYCGRMKRVGIHQIFAHGKEQPCVAQGSPRAPLGPPVPFFPSKGRTFACCPRLKGPCFIANNLCPFFKMKTP